MADGRHIENRFFGYISAPYCPINAKFGIEMKKNADIGHVTKSAIFANSRWRTAAILKIALSPYLSRELPDFDQIWYAYANFHSEDGYLTKIEIFQIQDGGLTPY